jgi:hypothetical protein
MRAQHVQVGEQISHLLRRHRGTPVSVHHLRDAVHGEHVGDEILGQQGRLGGGDLVPDDVPAINVDHHVGRIQARSSSLNRLTRPGCGLGGRAGPGTAWRSAVARDTADSTAAARCETCTRNWW